MLRDEETLGPFGVDRKTKPKWVWKIGKRSVLGGSALIVLHFSVIELEDCFESLLTGGDKKTAVGVW